MRSLLLVVGTLVGLLSHLPAYAQSTTKICVPIPAPPGGVASCQDVTTAFPLPIAGAGTGTGALAVTTTPGIRTIVTLDVKSVTTGGTAVTALAAGNRTAGGFLQNPQNAAANLCINEIGAATGSSSAGDTTCVIPGQGYVISPAAGAVSVVASDSAHPFSGYGLKGP